MAVGGAHTHTHSTDPRSDCCCVCVPLFAGEMLRALLEKSDKLAERLSAIEQAKEPSHGNRSHTRKSHSHVVKKRSFVDKDGSRVTEVVDDGGKAGGVACVWVEPTAMASWGDGGAHEEQEV